MIYDKGWLCVYRGQALLLGLVQSSNHQVSSNSQETWPAPRRSTVYSQPLLSSLFSSFHAEEPGKNAGHCEQFSAGLRRKLKTIQTLGDISCPRGWQTTSLKNVSCKTLSEITIIVHSKWDQSCVCRPEVCVCVCAYVRACVCVCLALLTAVVLQTLQRLGLHLEQIVEIESTHRCLPQRLQETSLTPSALIQSTVTICTQFNCSPQETSIMIELLFMTRTERTLLRSFRPEKNNTSVKIRIWHNVYGIFAVLFLVTNDKTHESCMRENTSKSCNF